MVVQVSCATRVYSAPGFAEEWQFSRTQYFVGINWTVGRLSHVISVFIDLCSHLIYLCTSSLRQKFFVDRVGNVWNALPSTVNFSTLAAFRNSIDNVDFSAFL